MDPSVVIQVILMGNEFYKANNVNGKHTGYNFITSVKINHYSHVSSLRYSKWNIEHCMCTLFLCMWHIDFLFCNISHMTGSKYCVCDSAQQGWQTMTGDLTEKDLFPIKEIRLGGAYSWNEVLYYQLGSFRCDPIGMYSSGGSYSLWSH